MRSPKARGYDSQKVRLIWSFFGSSGTRVPEGMLSWLFLYGQLSGPLLHVGL